MREEGEEEDHLTNDHLCKYSSKSPHASRWMERDGNCPVLDTGLDIEDR